MNLNIILMNLNIILINMNVTLMIEVVEDHETNGRSMLADTGEIVYWVSSEV